MKFKFNIVFVFSIAALLFGLTSVTRAGDTRYEIIEPYQPTQSGDKIEVVEFFWYGCPHCYDLEPYLEHWLKKLPEDVAYRRVPGVLSSRWINGARAYYTAEELGIVDKIHRPLFDAIHKEKERIDTQKHLAEFFAKHGVDKDEFNRIFESEAVTDKIKAAYLAARGSGIGGVPTIIVNGKFRTSSSLAGGNQALIKTINDLIDRER